MGNMRAACYNKDVVRKLENGIYYTNFIKEITLFLISFIHLIDIIFKIPYNRNKNVSSRYETAG